MVANLLGRLFVKAKAVGLFQGFSAIDRGPTVPFIQFVDDSLFMLDADLEGLRNLQCIILMVEAATGMRVNWSKSTLSPVASVTEVEEMIDIIGCDALPLHIDYFGLPLGAKSSAKLIWNPMLDKMSRRLAL